VGVPVPQAQDIEQLDPGIHAGENGDPQPGSRRVDWLGVHRGEGEARLMASKQLVDRVHRLKVRGVRPGQQLCPGRSGHTNVPPGQALDVVSTGHPGDRRFTLV
jgi:hypothetical protein